jgi:hypothetical protein
MTNLQTQNGFVKLYRALMSKGYYRDSEYIHLWVHLLMKASYQNRELFFNGKIQLLKPGQFITGRNSLVNETGINRSKIERILKCFKNEQQIEQQTFNKFRIITICNWNEYQYGEQENEQQVSNECAASEQQVSTNKKEKKEKKEKNITHSLDFLSFWKAYPRKVAKPEAWKAWKKLNGTRPSISEILKAIEEQKNSPQWIRDGGQFIPYPATWINQGRWTDERIEKHPLNGIISENNIINNIQLWQEVEIPL